MGGAHQGTYGEYGDGSWGYGGNLAEVEPKLSIHALNPFTPNPKPKP